MKPPRCKRDHFAEHLANGLSVKEAGERVGWSYEVANATLQKLRRKFGRQAA